MPPRPRAPRLFGRPMWSWGGAATNRWRTDRPELLWRCRVARAVLWPLCRVLTGHVQCPGETGYAGGGMLEVFCAYCMFPWQVPVDEMPGQRRLVELFEAGTPGD